MLIGKPRVTRGARRGFMRQAHAEPSPAKPEDGQRLPRLTGGVHGEDRYRASHRLPGGRWRTQQVGRASPQPRYLRRTRPTLTVPCWTGKQRYWTGFIPNRHRLFPDRAPGRESWSVPRLRHRDRHRLCDLQFRVNRPLQRADRDRAGTLRATSSSVRRTRNSGNF